MKAEINGVKVEGTPKEIAEYQQEVSKNRVNNINVHVENFNSEGSELAQKLWEDLEITKRQLNQ